MISIKLESMIGHSCYLYKTCNICDEVKYRKEFESKGRIRTKSYCRSCKFYREWLLAYFPEHFNKPYQKQKIDNNYLKLTDDNGIRIKFKTEKGKRLNKKVKLETAKELVKEGAATVLNEHTIRALYTPKSLRIYIFKRDRYTCHYCGKYGNTLDHIVSASKGGLETPKNSVCCCKKCNSIKADQEYIEFIKKMKDKK